MNRTSRKSALFLAALGVSFAVPAVRAQTVNWAGTNSSDWNDPGNWSPTGVPGSSSIADFNGSGNGNTNITLDGAGATIGAIQFDSGASSYDLGITTGDAFTINDGSISGTGPIGAIAVTGSVTNPEEIDAPITFTSATPVITNASAASLTLGALNTTATLSDSAATPTSLSIKFTSTSASNLTINDAITGSVGGTTTSGSAGAAGTASNGLIINGTSNGAATLILNGANTYTGITNINQTTGNQGNPVTILIGSNTAFGNSVIAYNTNGVQDPLQAYNGDRTVSNGFNMLSGFTVSNAATPHNLTFAGASTFSSGASRTVTINTFGQTVAFGASPSSNTLTLASTQSSGTAFNLAFNPAAKSDGSSPATLILNDIIQDLGSPTIPDTVSVNATNLTTPMGIIQFNGSNTFAGGVTISGQTGTPTFIQGVSVQVGVSSVGSGSLVTSGPFGIGKLTWNGNVSSLNFSGPGFLEPLGGDRTIGNNVTLTSGFFAQEIGSAGNTTNNLTLTGNITDPNGRLITNNLPSTAALTFGAPNTAATITGKFFLQGQIPTTGSVTNVYDNIIDTSASSLSSLLVQGAGGSGVTAMNLMGSNTYTGGTTVKSGATLTTNTNFGNGSLSFTNGTLGPAKGVVLVQATPGASNGVTVVPSLAIDTASAASSSQLDLTNNGLVVQNGSLTNIQNYITTGAATDGSGASHFTGPGITSSLAAAVAADSNNTHKTAIGYGLASAVLGISGPGTFLGKPVNPGDVLVRYTLAGDANLDGTVNALDFNALATNYGASGSTWVQGDYNYNGTVDSNDFALLAANYNDNIANAATSSLPADSLGAVVPEPTMMGLVGVSLVALRRRRNK